MLCNLQATFSEVFCVSGSVFIGSHKFDCQHDKLPCLWKLLNKFVSWVEFTLTDGCCMQLVTVLVVWIDPSFLGSFSPQNWVACFDLHVLDTFFLDEIAYFINIFLPSKSVPFNFNSFWCTFSVVNIHASPLLFLALSIKDMLTKQSTKQSILNKRVWKDPLQFYHCTSFW